MKHTAGRWDRNNWPVYFVASDVGTLSKVADLNNHLLVAVNELREHDMGFIERFSDDHNILIDSGVYWLATRHAEKHNLTMDVALGLAPDQVDNFTELYTRYIELIARIGDKSWGYIEIDQGGRDNKIKTRAKLEAQGFRPIPVYHPLNDGWDYFDELAKNYDRICFGNVVNANSYARRRMVATAWERRRRYPHLWIHLLGLTPSELTTAFPLNSCDSSTWIANVRWGVHSTYIGNQRSELKKGFVYDQQTDKASDTGHTKAVRLCGYDASITRRTMQIIANDQRDQLGADIGMFTNE